MFSPDAPVVHPGSIRHFRWLMERDFNSEAAGFYWQIHHNMLITDSPAFQQINDCFRFSLLREKFSAGFPSGLFRAILTGYEN